MLRSVCYYWVALHSDCLPPLWTSCSCCRGWVRGRPLTAPGHCLETLWTSSPCSLAATSAGCCPSSSKPERGQASRAVFKLLIFQTCSRKVWIPRSVTMLLGKTLCCNQRLYVEEKPKCLDFPLVVGWSIGNKSHLLSWVHDPILNSHTLYSFSSPIITFLATWSQCTVTWVLSMSDNLRFRGAVMGPSGKQAETSRVFFYSHILSTDGVFLFSELFIYPPL